MENQNPGNSIVNVPRNFTGVAVRKVVDLVNDKLSKGEKGLVLDFSKTETIDSFGIGQLVYIAKTMRKKSAQLTLIHLNDPIYRLFRETGLDQLFAIEGVKQDVLDFFESSIDIRLTMRFEEVGDVGVFKMAGVMDHIGGSRFFRQQILLALASRSKIVLDLTELTFFDSLSISAVLDMHKLLRQTGGQLAMCGANYIITDLFTTLNLNAVVPYYPTLDEAIAGWK